MPSAKVERVPFVLEEPAVKIDTANAPSHSEPSQEEGGAGEGPLSPSAFELVRRVVVGVVQAIEDGAELLGASFREELGRFRADLIRSLVATSLLIAGGGLLTAGLALVAHAWIGAWPPVLLVLGGLYLVVGGWLLFASSSARGEKR